MNWQDQIEINTQVLAGKPVILGTRLAVVECSPNIDPGVMRALIDRGACPAAIACAASIPNSSRQRLATLLKGLWTFQ